MTASLAASGLSVSYGGVQALADVDLKVRRGEIVGLIGPNGAGKTTFIDAVTGFTTCRGTVTVGGSDVSSLAPHERARRGLARTWQAAELFDDLTVAENLAVAGTADSVWDLARRTLRRGPGAGDRTQEVLARLGIESLAAELPATLSQGQRKLVGVGRALMGGPSVVLLDEPAAGLDSEESGELASQLRLIAETGPGILLVDHDMGLVLSVCDRVAVLDFGRVIATGPPEEIRSDPAVITAYIGDEAATVLEAELP